MAKGRSRDPRKEQQWQRWIGLWRESGLSVRDFCARHRLPTPRFYAWRRLLEQRFGPAASFLPVHVLTDDPPACPPPIEVALPDGSTLRVPSGCDPATLRCVLAALQQARPC